MSETLGSILRETLRDTVPFVAIMLVWIVVMLVVYAVFLVSIPENVSYSEFTYASVFVPPLVGFAGHTLREALKTRDD